MLYIEHLKVAHCFKGKVTNDSLPKSKFQKQKMYLPTSSKIGIITNNNIHARNMISTRRFDFRLSF